MKAYKSRYGGWGKLVDKEGGFQEIVESSCPTVFEYEPDIRHKGVVAEIRFLEKFELVDVKIVEI